MNASKIIEILDPQAGRIKETILTDRAPEKPAALFEAKPGARRLTLQEAANTADFPVLLRQGIRAIVYENYAGTATTWQDWADVQPSDKQSEDWIEQNSPGELPVVFEGAPYPERIADPIDRTLNIRNQKRGDTLSVTEEMIRFNRIAQVRLDAANAGRRAANTREVACYTVLTTAGNYVRTTAAGDNDIGNNTAAATFAADTLNTALSVLRTMKDRKSGAYFGVNPDMLIVTPALEMAAKQLLLSPAIAYAAAATTGATVYGTGSSNPFRGLVSRIIVSPRLGTSYQWVLMEAKRAVLLQEVEGLQVLQEHVGMVESEAYFKYDTIRFRVRDWFGVGMLNDRFAYYSSSTSAPTVA